MRLPSSTPTNARTNASKEIATGFILSTGPQFGAQMVVTDVDEPLLSYLR
jgi:hypothetical protein